MLASEPLSIGGVLDSGFGIYRKTLKAIVPVALVCAAIMALSGLGLANSLDPSMMEEQTFRLSPTFAIFWFLSVVSALFFFLVVAQRQWELIQGNTPALVNDLLRGVALLFPAILASVLYYLFVVIGMVLVIIPGLIVMVSLGMYLFVPIVEGGGPWHALMRSHKLVWNGNWFRTAAVFTVVLVIMLAISLVFQLFAGGAQGFKSFMEPTQPSVFATLFGVTISVVIYPLLTAVALALYNDLLLRKEGSDLDARLESLDES